MAKSTTAPAKSKKSAPKKTAPKKVAKKAVTTIKPKKKEATINIKYDDKSAGQPELAVIFDAIRKMVLPYANKRALKLHENTGGQFNLVSHKPVEIAGKKREELWFVSALVQKGYVGFYYSITYMQDQVKKEFSPEFMKCLKGKGCFHIKKNDPLIMENIKKAIKIGFDDYVKKGWI
jgi:hypothetical protein